MRRSFALAAPALVAALGVLQVGCSSCKKTAPRTTAKPSATVEPPKAPEAPRAPPSQPEEVTFEGAGKVMLAGTLYPAEDKAAPIVVLVHRFWGDRAEWAPFATRLAAAEKRYTVLNFDLRGHGASRTGARKKSFDAAGMVAKDIPELVDDVHAALHFAVERSGGKADRAVLVGSSLGAAIAARAASQDPMVVALALVSPGAAIQGFDVYHPFADVRMLPSFLAGAKDDNVCKDPLDGLARMAKESATLKLYPGNAHGAYGLAAEGGQLFEDLEAWLMQVFDARRVERAIVPRAEGTKKERRG